MVIDSKLKKIVESIKELPPFPDAALRILDLSSYPETGIDDVVKVIQHDQAITGNCLKLCNSSYFGLVERVTSINHAVVLLGTENILKVVFTSCSKLPSYARELKGYNLQAGELWRHSVGCALLSQILLKKSGQLKGSHELYTACLLHDIGKLIIDSYIADDFGNIFSLMQDEEYGLADAEKEFFGIDHAEVGGLIARSWNFPDPLIHAIENHHADINDTPQKDLAAWTGFTNLVHHLSSIYASTNYRNGITVGIEKKLLDRFDFTQKDINDVITAFYVEMEKAEDFLNLSSANA
ncbi:MAG: HDOD domain-containing protein [Desulfobulbaceae bacterium]|nr:HDOD domain-containing protein [Desulfobulbaceae bacterium]